MIDFTSSKLGSLSGLKLNWSKINFGPVTASLDVMTLFTCVSSRAVFTFTSLVKICRYLQQDFHQFQKGRLCYWSLFYKEFSLLKGMEVNGKCVFLGLNKMYV